MTVLRGHPSGCCMPFDSYIDLYCSYMFFALEILCSVSFLIDSVLLPVCVRNVIWSSRPRFYLWSILQASSPIFETCTGCSSVDVNRSHLNHFLDLRVCKFTMSSTKLAAFRDSTKSTLHCLVRLSSVPQCLFGPFNDISPSIFDTVVSVEFSFNNVRMQSGNMQFTH